MSSFLNMVCDYLNSFSVHKLLYMYNLLIVMDIK